ncbi:MAG: lipopolysaccharide biosynthesis protein [Bacteroidales bacterium]|nr:lipopolysaccharide biosynthesis protein [Bacteroidales bacterium]
MQENSLHSNSKRAAKNTLFLYARMILIMGVALFTSRILLHSLGETDFGLKGVIADLVVVFSFISGSLATATSRYLSFDLGKGDNESLARTFMTVTKMLRLMALGIFIVGTIVGTIIINTKLNIPDDRIVACNISFFIVMVTSAITIVQVPYNAMIIAHERMNIYAYIGIIDAIAKCIIAYIIYVSPVDRLVMLSALQCILSILILAFYIGYCRRKLGTSEFRHTRADRKLGKEMLAFSSWNLLGSASITMKNQGVNILINMFFGATINAANAIAYQINTAVMNFTNGFTTAMNPQIIKRYADGDINGTQRIIFTGGKFTFFLITMLSVPIIVECEYFLRIWLKDFPAYTIVLTRLVLLLSIVECFNYTIGTAIQATGKIKWYQIVVSGLSLFNFPITYLAYRLGAEPYVALMISIAISSVTLAIRLCFLKKHLGIAQTTYIKKVIVRVVPTAIAAIATAYLVHINFQAGTLRTILVIASSLLTTLLMMWTTGLTEDEKDALKNIVNSKIKRTSL